MNAGAIMRWHSSGVYARAYTADNLNISGGGNHDFMSNSIAGRL